MRGLDILDKFLGGLTFSVYKFIFMCLATAIGAAVSLITPPPQEIQNLVQNIRISGSWGIHGTGDIEVTFKAQME